jgi:hypothetical protein
MSLIPCPDCGLPRADDDVEATACPVCGYRRPESEPLTVAESVKVEEPPSPPAEPPAPRPARARGGLFLGGALAAGLGLVSAGVFWFAGSNWPTATVAPPAPELVLAPVTPPPLAVAPPPRFVPELAPAPRLARLKPPQVRPKVAAVAELIPAPRPVVEAAELVRVDRPGQEYQLGRLDGKRVRLVGQARRLVVAGLDDGAVLDATGLAVEDVLFTGPVAGGSTARVRADGAGGVFFAGPVTGGSRVAVEAGFVGFVDVARGRGSEVAGGSRVEVTARGVYLGGPVTGPDTRAEVTLTGGGVLWFEELDAGATLRYRAAAGAGPPEVLHRGAVRGGAVVERVK